MNLPEVSHDKKNIQGFTLIEMLLVTSLLLILGVLTFPVGLAFYVVQQHSEAVEGVHDALKRAQEYARTGKNDSSFGVRMMDDAYVLFQGDTYAEREIAEDTVFPVSDMLSFGGDVEVVFQAHSGSPVSPGLIHIDSARKSDTISVNALGRIDH